MSKKTQNHIQAQEPSEKAELGGNATSFPEWTAKEKVEELPQGLIAALNLSKHWHPLLN